MFASNTRILVIDDMSTMRKLVAKSLQELGFTNVIDAEDGEQAWKMIQDAHFAKKDFQLIISDWNMPKMKGVDLLAKVRSLPQISGTPFILLTAEAERDQVAIAVKAGVSGYLLKPFSREQLLATLTGVYNKVKKSAAA